jgi:hypothetical protein
MTQHLPYDDICNCIMDDISDVSDLCVLLELDVQDILEAFPEQVLANIHKFLLPSITDGVLDDDEDEEEETFYEEEKF